MTREVPQDRTMIHLNSNLLCALRISKSGPRPRYHDLIEICVIPVNSTWRPMTTIMPFYQMIQPKRKENIEDASLATVNREELYHICEHGIDAYAALDLFDMWFENLMLKTRKKISLLVSNWGEDREFVLDWVQPEGYAQYFDHRIRDVSVAALYANDKADSRAEPVPYPKTHLQYLCSQLKVSSPKGRDIMEEA